MKGYEIMKNYTKFLVAILLGLMFLSSHVTADPFKGGRILSNAITEGCPMLIPDLAGTHSSEEWKQIVKEGKLEETIHQICPKAKIEPIPQDKMKDVLDFLQYYSQDGGALPSC
jgi:hypothetical protein